MSVDAVRILRGIAVGVSLYGEVLALGDIASAYCVDREGELSRGGVLEKAANDCGVNFFPNPGPGRRPLFSEPGGKFRLAGLLVRLGNPYWRA